MNSENPLKLTRKQKRKYKTKAGTNMKNVIIAAIAVIAGLAVNAAIAAENTAFDQLGNTIPGVEMPVLSVSRTQKATGGGRSASVKAYGDQLGDLFPTEPEGKSFLKPGEDRKILEALDFVCGESWCQEQKFEFTGFVCGSDSCVLRYYTWHRYVTPEPELKITHTSGYSIIDANNIYRVECVIRNLHKYEDIRDDRDDLMLNENFLETMNQVLARSF